jgi:hypothetical protein
MMMAFSFVFVGLLLRYLLKSILLQKAIRKIKSAGTGRKNSNI